jgi:SAM-dependent methyltransferase
MLTDEVLTYYQRLGEVSRLDRGAGRLEFLRTWDVLQRTLPGAPADVLDVGGATGVYAGPLAAQGYRVHVIDPVPEHVAASGALPGVTANVGDARTLDRPDASADAVLLFGPLYHLLDAADRRRAWQEAGRVARPGAPIVGALISRFAALLDGYVKGHAADERFRAIVSHGLESGEHLNNTDEVGWFTTAYFHHPAEIAAEVTGAGLVLDRVVMVESAVWMTGPDQLTELLEDPQRRAELLDRLRAVEDEPSLLGSSSHLLVIAHRD